MGKTFWIVLGIIVAVMIGGFVLLGDDAQAPSQSTTDGREITAEDHTQGPDDAAVTLVEYGDFQCPACGAAEPLLQQLKAEYPDELRFVWRHFPLTQIHPQAYDAARASEAAAAQGKFWEMHDLLFERQQEWSGDPSARSRFESYAEELGLTMEQYRSDFDNASDRVDRDVQIGQSVGANSTPTFVLNGEKIEQNPRTYEEFKSLIEDEIGQAQNNQSADQGNSQDQ